MGDFNQIINKFTTDYRATVQAGHGEAYSKLSSIIGELEHYLREYLQELSGKDVKNLINKLKHGETISPPELELIRLWLVGDAEYYLQHENNFNDWTKELSRLVDTLQTCNVDKPDVMTVCRFRSILRDAGRVIADILYYVQQNDRVQKFTESTREIDAEERAILARLLEQKLKSKDF